MAKFIQSACTAGLRGSIAYPVDVNGVICLYLEKGLIGKGAAMLRIGTKLGIGIGVLLALCIVIGLVSYTQTGIVRRKIEEITKVREPANSAVYALENNLVETAFATLGYLSTGDTAMLATLKRQRNEIPLAEQRFSSAADSGQGSRERINREFQQLLDGAAEQIRLRDEQAGALEQLFQSLDSIDELLAERIQASVSVNDPVAYRRLQAVLEMRVHVTAMTRGVVNFLLTGDPLFERRVGKAEGDFKQYFSIYQVVLLNADEDRWSRQLRRLSGETIRIARAIISLDKQRREQLAAFLAVDRSLGTELNDRVQRRTEASLGRATEEVFEAGQRANRSILLVLAISIAFGIVAGFVTTKSITRPIAQLASVMQAIANGDRARKVVLRAGGELHALGEAFNLMTGRLLQANADLRAQIEVRQRTEEALRVSEERFRQMIDGVRDYAIFMLGPEGRGANWNAGAERMFGYAGADIVGEDLGVLYPEEERRIGLPRKILDRAASEGRTEVEGLRVRKDGTRFWANVVLSAIRDTSGVLLGYSKVTRDITARRATEQQMRMLAHTITSLNESVVITDLQDTILSVNPAFSSMYGYEPSEAIGRDASFLRLRPVDRSFGPSIRSQRLAGGWSGELLAARKSGEDFPVTLSTSVVRDDTGAPIAIVSISRDITEQTRLRRQLEEAERQQLSGLKRFAVSVQRAQEEERARISRELHDDLCQRLSGMKFAAEVITDRILPGNRKAIRELRGFAADLDRAISEVRRISGNLRPSALDDFGLMIALKMLCKEFQTQHGVRTSLELGGPVPQEINADAEIALYRIAQEALSNIAKHARAGAATIVLQMRDADLRLTVRDDGKGFVADAPAAAREPGHGLGLISMRERTELLGGSFAVTSAPNTGTTITVTIPVGEPTTHEENTNSDC